MFQDSVDYVSEITGEDVDSDYVYVIYEQAVDWAQECVWVEGDCEIEDMDVCEVIKSTHRWFEGGLVEFIKTVDFSKIQKNHHN